MLGGFAKAGNFGDLGQEDRKKVTGIWNRLLANEDIRIEETGEEAEVAKPQKGFRTKVLADFSRLLETEAGRHLVGGIQEAGGGVTIKPTTVEKGKFVARSLDPDSEGLKTVPAPDEEHQQDFAPIDVNGMTKQEKIRLFHNIRTRHPDKRGFSLTTDQGTQHFAFGKGSKSELKVPVDARDAMPHPSSRGVDSEGNEILSPTFVNLGLRGRGLRQGLPSRRRGDLGARLLSASPADRAGLARHAVPLPSVPCGTGAHASRARRRSSMTSSGFCPAERLQTTEGRSRSPSPPFCQNRGRSDQ